MIANAGEQGVTEIAKIEVAGLTGPQKAAAILLTLASRRRRSSSTHSRHEELRLVTMAAARLGAIPAAASTALVEEFAPRFPAGPCCSATRTRRAICSPTPRPADQVDRNSRRPRRRSAIPTSWKAARNIARRIARELPQRRASGDGGVHSFAHRTGGHHARRRTAAARDSQRDAGASASPADRLAAGLEIIEKALRRTLLGGVSATGDDNRTRLAEIINNLGTPRGGRFHAHARRDPSAGRPVVRKMLFSFQDLTRLSQRGRALLFDKLSTDVVVLALRGTDHDFREPVLSAMASRSRRLVESELGQPSGAPPIETEKARRQIVKLVLVMAQRGEIELPTSDEEEGAAA